MALISRPRLVVLRALGLGDLLTGLPALRALRKAFCDHQLILAAPRALTDLVHLAGAADGVLDTGGLHPLAWTGPSPRLAVNLHGRGPQSHRLLAALGPVELAAFGCPEADHYGPLWRPDEHEVDRWCRLVTESLGVPADRDDLYLRQPPGVTSRFAQPQRRTAIVHPGAAYPSRRWPAHRWAAVARYLADHGFHVLLTGGPDEASLVESVLEQAGLGAAHSLAGRTSLSDLVGVVGSAHVLVCGDTGVAHLGTALRVPSVLLFGPTSPQRWGPPPDRRHRVLWHGEGTGDPWGAKPDQALLQITVDEVVDALDGLLSDVDAQLLSEPTESLR